MVSFPIERFFEACEASPPLRLHGTLRRSDGKAESSRCWTLAAPFAVVGSDPRADLHLDDPLISPRHCLLQVLGPKILAIDLGSDRGLVASDGPCLAGWIEPGRDVGIGGHLLGIVPESQTPRNGSSTSWLSRKRDETPVLSGRLPRIVLEIRAQRLTTTWGMRGAIVLVGSDPSCSLRLSGSGIARFHSALLRTNRGLWVIDLLGEMERNTAGGTIVNGESVRFGPLAEGDRLEIGEFTLSPRVHSARPISTGILGDMARPGRVQPSEGVLVQRTSQAVPVSATVVPTEHDPKAFATELLRLIDLQRQEIASLRRDVDKLRGKLESAINPPSARPKNLSPRPSHSSVRNARPRTLGTAHRLTSPSAARAIEASRASTSPAPPPPLEPNGVAHAESQPNDALAFW